MAKYTLGISCYYHDSGAALTKEGVILGALQEERFSRVKNDDAFPHQSIQRLLQDHNVSPEEIDKVVYYEKPFLTFERLIESFHATWPRSFRSFLKVIPLWIKEKIFLKNIIKEELEDLAITNAELLFPEHHLSHLGASFYPSPFNEAAILSLDGVGEWKTLCMAKGSGKTLTRIAHQDFPHSLGLFYSAFTAFCGFQVNRGEYKLMGLAPYAKVFNDEVENFQKLIKEHLIFIKEDGSFTLDLKYFMVESAFDLIPTPFWEKLFGLKRLPLGETLTKEHACLALACQKVTEEIILALLKTLKEKTQLTNVCLSGGVALNSVANGLIAREKIFDRVWIQPASGDAGSALGAALLGDYIHRSCERTVNSNDSMQGSLLGTQYNDESIEAFLLSTDLPIQYEKLSDEESTLEHARDDLAKDLVIGWFQGRMEFGPRALGSRSILANAGNLNNQKRVNQKIKKREGFRPFAPAVLKDDYLALFPDFQTSPYMQFVHFIKDDLKGERVNTGDYKDLPDFIKEQLSFSESLYPAITHVDGSCRVQMVSESHHPLFYRLIEKVRENQKHGIVLNTSFNVRGEPIVESPGDALNCFLSTDLDILYLGNFRVTKNS